MALIHNHNCKFHDSPVIILVFPLLQFSLIVGGGGLVVSFTSLRWTEHAVLHIQYA
jgi:hypothetical protein